MPNHRKKNNFIKQAGILAIAGILCRIIGILYRSPLTHIIGDEGNGYYSAAYNIYTIILLISSYSIPTAISKEIAQKLSMKEYKNAQRIFHCALIYVFIIGSVVSLLTFFYAEVLVEKNSAFVLRIFAPTIFFSGILGVLRGYFQAHKTMLQTSISQIIEQILNAVISIIAAFLLMKTVAIEDTTTKAIYGAVGSAVGTGAGVVIALLFMLLIYLFNQEIIRKRIQRDSSGQIDSFKKIMQRIVLTVTPMILSTFIYNLSTSLNQTIYTKTSIYWSGLEETRVAISYGIFAGKAVVISNIPIAIASAISAAMLPAIAGTFVQGDLNSTNRNVDIATRTTMMISIPAAVGLAVLARPIVQLLFPQKESLMLASSLLRYLSITVVFYSLSTLTNAVLQGIGKVNLPVIHALISLCLQTTLLLIILFCTKWDLYGLAIATIIYSLLMCLLNGLSIRKYLSYRQNMKSTFLIPSAASAVMGLIAVLSYKGIYWLSKSNALSLLLSIMIAAVIYFILIIKLGGISEQELSYLPKENWMVQIMKKMISPHKR